MAGKADSKRLKQSNDPLQNDKLHHKFPQNKSSPPRFPQKSEKNTTENFPNPPNHLKPDGTPKATLYSSSLQFLLLDLDTVGDADALLLMTTALEWVSLSTFPGNPVTNALLNPTIPPTRFSKLLHFPTTRFSHKVNVDDRWFSPRTNEMFRICTVFFTFYDH